jgi:hypothetical protein
VVQDGAVNSVKVNCANGYIQLVSVAILGMMSFTSSNFWLALFMQEVSKYDALIVAVHLLPQVIAGIIWNVVAASILHRVNNAMIMGFGSLAYVGANLLLTFQKSHTAYWAFIFPSLIMNVIGADFQFNVTNVSHIDLIVLVVLVQMC